MRDAEAALLASQPQRLIHGKRTILEDRVRRGNAKAVAALLGLRAVGVEDADRHRIRIEGQQAIRAETDMPVAQPRQQLDQLVERAG
jgi:hypothetical protein